MAVLVGPGPSVGQTDEVHSEQKNPIGLRRRDADQNEYIYMQGVASLAQYDWVTYDEDYVTTRTVADAQGRVAIAQAAIDATTEYGWYLIYGTGSGKCLASFADNGKVYLTSTAGSVDDADVAGDFVIGAIGRSARNATTGVADFELNYPVVQDMAFD